MAKLASFCRYFVLTLTLVLLHQVLTEEKRNATTTDIKQEESNVSSTVTPVIDEAGNELTPQATTCPPDTFSCSSGECINITKVCDDTEDCKDASDENNCPKETESPSTACPHDSFSCSSGECINITKVCDNTEDCKDGSDENICREQSPSFFLTSVHSPSPEGTTINAISSNLLAVTKDLLSFTPRTYQNVSWQIRLEELQKLQDKDIAELLSQRGIIVPPHHTVTCGVNTQYYRTLDGSCNNFLHPCWGKKDEPYMRWLPPVYANGIDELRKRADGNPLPSPREVYQWVSSQLEQDTSTTYDTYSNLIVVWGQMLAHDIILTPSVTVKIWDGKKFIDEAPDCCKPGTPHPDCIPVVMNYDDGFYSRGHCMDIARSAAYVYSPHSCRPLKLGLAREQMNQVTAFIDASLVYSVSEEHMRKLRENNGLGAKLIMEFYHGVGYPPRKDDICKSVHHGCDKRCFLAGEKRANENPVLGAMHTIWVREHNRLVDLLRGRGWSEETLFHVVRKIVGALFQHITYKEYLPKVVGPMLAGAMNLTVPTTKYHYDSTMNPTIYNVFVTAAFRYGHSMISGRYMRRGRSYAASPLLSQDFFSMDEFCGPLEDSVASLLYGQADQKAQKVDCLFSKQITNHLFSKEVNGKGLDLFSLNVQRGRDHGIPPYNKWRETCGLPKAKDYSDLKSVMPDYVVDKLAIVYGPGGIDEIDLYVAGVSEYPVNGGILGPTFTCIVANQFKHLKFGDRFWYENTDHPGAFTQAQIDSIRKNTLASLLCRNSDIKFIQPQAFLSESSSNPKLHCDTILKETDLNLNLWL